MALTGDDYRNAGNVRTRRFKESKASTGYKQVGIFMSAESRELLHTLKQQHGWTNQEAVEHIFKTYKNAMNDVVKDVVINNVIDNINNVDNNIKITTLDTIPDTQNLNDAESEQQEVLVYPDKILDEYEQPIHQKAKFYNDKLLEDYKHPALRSEPMMSLRKHMELEEQKAKRKLKRR